MSPTSAPQTALPGLDKLLVKERVAIGGLPDPQRRLALAFVWAGLPPGPLTERAVNDALRAQLAGPAGFLDTDHVELRRWLVDAGWLHRDGYGREYRRVPVAELPDAAREAGAALDGLETTAFAAACRAEHEAARAARRRAFESRATGKAAVPQAHPSR